MNGDPSENQEFRVDWLYLAPGDDVDCAGHPDPGGAVHTEHDDAPAAEYVPAAQGSCDPARQ